MAKALSIRTFGRLAINVDEAPCSGFASRKAEMLLVYLACNRRPHPREVLAELLWDSRPQRQAMANLRVVLSSLRHQVGAFVTITRSEASIADDAQIWLDATVLEEATAPVRKCGGITDDAVASEVEAALQLYVGDFLAGIFVSEASGFENWAGAQRERLHRQALGALQYLASWYLACNEHGPAVAAATRLVELDVLAEAGHRLLMQALSRNGQRGVALAQYETCRTLLAQELGVEPAPETIALRDSIIAGTLPEQVAQVAMPSPDLTTPAVIHEAPFLVHEERPRPQQERFLERGDELVRLREHLQEALVGNGRVIFVKGEAGAGKTATIQAFAREASDTTTNLLVAGGNCSAMAETGSAYGPFRQIASLLAGDVEDAWHAGLLDELQARRLWRSMPIMARALVKHGPHLLGIFVDADSLLQRVSQALGQPVALHDALQAQQRSDARRSDDLQRQDLHEEYAAVLTTLAREQPLLLILDDLQWLDRPSLDLLFHLSRALTSTRTLLLGSYRPQEATQPLQKVVAECKRLYGAIEIDLDGLPATSGRAFIDQLLDGEPNRLGRPFREALFARTGGHPLFTIELLRALQERGDLAPDKQGLWFERGSVAWERLPAQIEGVIETRLAHLGDSQLELLRVASVEGEDFTVEVAAKALRRDGRDVVQELSGALEQRHRLVAAEAVQRVRGQRLSRYRFRHRLFQEYLYRSLDEVERVYLHEDVGRALEELYADRPEAIATQLCHHYATAGIGDKTVTYALMAGDAALNLFAYEEAIDYYEQALRFLKEQGGSDRAGRLLMKLGLALHNAGRFAEANLAYDEGFHVLRDQPAMRCAVPSPPLCPLRTTFPETGLAIDPARADNGWSAALLNLLFIGLVREDEHLKLVPGASDGWSIEEGGKRYLFRLRPDGCWSDGQPLTAHDFVFAWRRVLDPATQAAEAARLYEVRGARAYHEGRNEDPNSVAVRAIDDFTLEVELEHSTSYFLYTLSNVNLLPVPRHVVHAHRVNWACPELFVSNGPFKLATWETGRSLILERNERCVHRGTGNVERVVLDLTREATREEQFGRRLGLYASGALDVLTRFSSPDLGRLRRRYPNDFRTGPLLSTFYLFLNQWLPPFDDVRVRRALALALDREVLSAATSFGADAAPAEGGLLPPGIPGFAEGVGLGFAPDEARRLLAEAGFPDADGFPEVYVLTWAAMEPRLQAVIEQWRLHLGLHIAVRCDAHPPPVQWQRGDAPCAFYGGWTAEYPDASSFLIHALGANHPSFENQRFDELLEQARITPDAVKRATIYRQADTILTQDAYVVPTYYRRLCSLVKPWIRHFPMSSPYCWQWENILVETH